MVAKNSLIPNRLPPTIAAATEHILRVYLQYRNWVMLNAESRNPLDYGWKLAPGGTYEPVLDLICCSVDMEQLFLNEENMAQFLPACGRCHGVNCTNARQDILEEQDILEVRGSFD